MEDKKLLVQKLVWKSLNLLRSTGESEGSFVLFDLVFIKWFLDLNPGFRNIHLSPHSQPAHFLESMNKLLVEIQKFLSEERFQIDRSFFSLDSFLSKYAHNIIQEIFYNWETVTFNEKEKEKEFIPPEIAFQILIHETPPFRDISTPLPIARLISGLADLKPNAIVYNPASGAGSLIIQSAQDEKIRQSVRFIGQEINTNVFQVCNLLMLVYGIRKADIRREDVFSENSISENFNADLAFSNPPLALRLRDSQREELNKLRFFPIRASNSDIAFLSLMINNLKEGGRAIAVVQEGFLVNISRTKQFREFLLKNYTIEGIISLPAGTLSKGNLKTSIIIVRNDNPRSIPSPRPIQFVKIKNNLSSELANNIALRFLEIEKGARISALGSALEDEIAWELILPEEIDRNSYSLSAEYYTHENRKLLNQILSQTEYEVLSIGEITRSSLVGKRASKEILTQDEKEGIPFIKLSDLSNNRENLELDVTNIQSKIDLRKAKTPIRFLEEPVILVNLIGKGVNGVFFNYDGKPIAVGPEILILSLKERINPVYFVSQLNSQLVEIQVEMRKVGTAIQRIRKDDFLDIQIILPPESEQERQILEIQEQLRERAKLERQKEASVEAIYQTEYDVVATIAHNLNQKLGILVDDFDTLKDYLNRKEHEGTNVNLSEPVAKLFPGDEPEQAEKVKDIIERFTATLSDATGTLKKTQDILQKNSVSREDVSLRKFLEKLKRDLGGKNYTISVKGKDLIAPIDVEAMREVFRNLVENAKKHGFTGSEHMYQIILGISKEIDRNTGKEYAKIEYSNNGAPFPEGFSFEEYKRLAGRGGRFKGTGIGGFIINKIIKLHGGEFRYISKEENQADSYNVKFEIILPLN